MNELEQKIDRLQGPILVLGASGFIGGHLVRRLTALGCRVSCPVRATSRVDDLRLAGVQLIACDIADRAGVARAIALRYAKQPKE
jgi:uncharacterized protein YbjT (DUF2867 family)